MRAWVLGVVGVLLLAGCSAGASNSSGAAPSSASSAASSAGPSPAAASAAGGLPTPAHVVVAIFENKDAGQVQGKAPFLDSLAAQGAALTDAHGVGHPSQPNYLALFSGSTQGVTSDACPLSFTGDNLAAQLQAAGKSFVGYSETLPQAGYTGCHGGAYARKHAPWVDFPALPASVNQPLSAMPGDFSNLPTVAFVVPDLCSDMHDCPVPVGDAWAQQNLGPYVDWAKTHDSLLVVTFDEDDGTSDNHIATVVVGAGVRPGSTDAARVDHYSLLRTIEDMYRLPPLGQAAQAAPIQGIWG